MIKIGTYNYLKIKQAANEGVILTDGEKDIMLSDPQPDPEIGSELLVFLYHQKDGNVVATTKRPYACAGDFAFLKVVDKTDTGTYLDLGIDKDLFIPSTKQLHPLEKGKNYVVYVYLDKIDGKLTATTWLEDKVETDLSSLEEGTEVSLLIYDKSDLGYSAIIDNRYMGLLYRNEVYEELEIGENRTGYIKKIRAEDNKIDLSLRQVGFDFILDSRDVVLNLLKENNGVLDLGDKSSPEEIREQLKMSKKAFKQVIGGLYKQRLITMTENQIRLAAEEKDLEAEQKRLIKT